MRVDTARKWIRQNLPRLQKRFKLEDWELTIEVSKSISDDEDESRVAICQPNCDYQFALIDIGVENIGSNNELEMILCHELLHCVLSPIDQIRDLMAESDNELAKSIFYRFYYSTIERTVRNLELILNLGIKSAKIV
jgi:hypothetical protein